MWSVSAKLKGLQGEQHHVRKGTDMGNPMSFIKEDFSCFHEFICYPAAVLPPRKKYMETQSGTAIVGHIYNSV